MEFYLPQTVLKIGKNQLGWCNMYNIVKIYNFKQWKRCEVIPESEIYLDKEKAEIDRIYFQPDYNELLEVRTIDKT